MPVATWTPTVRLWVSNFHWSVVLVLGAVAIQALEVYAFELPKHRRLVRDAPEFAMRVAGLSHFVVALFFLLTGSRARGGAAWARLGALSLGGAGVCVAFAWLGGPANPLCLAGFYVIFMAHAFRDEGFFHREHLASTATSHSDSNRLWLQTIAVAVLATIVVPVYVYVAFAASDPAGNAWLAAFPIKAGEREMSMIRALLPGSWSATEIFAMFGLPFALVAAAAAIPVATTGPAWRAHMPLLKVLALSTALVVLGGLVGGVPLRLVILMHFVAWFRFTTARLQRAERLRPAGVTMSVTAWLRGTVHGFRVLHLGAAAVFLALIAVNHYLVSAPPLHSLAAHVPNSVALFFGAAAFFYWTIAHVALSVPLPARRRSA